MEYIAIEKNIKITPRKMRLVSDAIKKYEMNRALSALKTMQKRAAGPLKKALESAISNAVNNFKATRESLTITDIIITEGPSMKRYHFAARGRTRPYKKRSSHIRVILTDKAGNKELGIPSTSLRASKNKEEKSKTENSSIETKEKEEKV